MEGLAMSGERVVLLGNADVTTCLVQIYSKTEMELPTICASKAVVPDVPVASLLNSPAHRHICFCNTIAAVLQGACDVRVYYVAQSMGWQVLKGENFGDRCTY